MQSDNSKMRNSSQENNPEELFTKAASLYQSGNPEEAKVIAETLLTSYPRNAYVLNLLGIIAEQKGDLQHARQLLEKAVTHNPQYAEAHNNYGFVLYKYKHYTDALSHYNKAIIINHDFVQAYKNRALAFYELVQYEDALQDYCTIITLGHGQAETYNSCGIVLYKLKRYSEALENYNQAIAIKPDYTEAYQNRSIVLSELKRYEEAIASSDKAITLDPACAMAYNSRGAALENLRRYDEALASYDKAIAIDPALYMAYNNKGNILSALKQYGEALENHDKAIAINADYADARWNKSLLKLLSGDFEEGWKLHESRWEKSDRSKHEQKRFNKPLWLGKESLKGKTILLHAEQGLGDTIQFCRYARMVEKLGARVVLETQKSLVSLLATLGKTLDIRAQGSELPDFDFHCPLMSLPLAFGTSINTIPAHIPYLSVDLNKQKELQQYLGVKKHPRIGLIWSGTALHKNDHNRSMALSMLSPLFKSDCSFYSLQKEVRPEDEAILKSSKIISFAEDLKDFTDTAALILEMDLVISVDTSVAHLAGALGKPVWILLPCNPDFRWLLDREDSPWYPTARLFRQEGIGDWESVIEKIKAEVDIFTHRTAYQYPPG